MKIFPYIHSQRDLCHNGVKSVRTSIFVSWDRNAFSQLCRGLSTGCSSFFLLSFFSCSRPKFILRRARHPRDPKCDPLVSCRLCSGKNTPVLNAMFSSSWYPIFQEITEAPGGKPPISGYRISSAALPRSAVRCRCRTHRRTCSSWKYVCAWMKVSYFESFLSRYETALEKKKLYVTG